MKSLRFYFKCSGRKDGKREENRKVGNRFKGKQGKARKSEKSAATPAERAKNKTEKSGQQTTFVLTCYNKSYNKLIQDVFSGNSIPDMKET